MFPVKTFALSTLYAFLSAMLVGFALNLFAGAILSEGITCSKASCVYAACVLFALSAFSFFLVSWLLENARNAWLAENAPIDPAKRDFHIEIRRHWLIASFMTGTVCVILGCLVLMPSNPISLLPDWFFCSIPKLKK